MDLFAKFFFRQDLKNHMALTRKHTSHPLGLLAEQMNMSASTACVPIAVHFGAKPNHCP